MTVSVSTFIGDKYSCPLVFLSFASTVSWQCAASELTWKLPHPTHLWVYWVLDWQFTPTTGETLYVLVLLGQIVAQADQNKYTLDF